MYEIKILILKKCILICKYNINSLELLKMLNNLQIINKTKISILSQTRPSSLL